MADLAGMVVVARAYAATARARYLAFRATVARSRHVLISAALVVAGLAGLLGFASLLGGWCVGLVGMAESGWAVWLGVNRDDGLPLPRRGERTIADVAEEYRRLPS